MVSTQLEARGVRDPEVLNAMRLVRRDRFVPSHLAEQAYDDNALPISRGQTISQPYIVACMTEALALPAWRDAHPGRPLKVLDVGTGSGYQAAVLAQMGAQVISIEREADLARDAERRLAELGYAVQVVVGDGSEGVPAEAPFAGIVVAAASPNVPQPLVDQLAPDGRLVVPVGTRWEQRIKLVRREGDDVTSEWLEPAIFVPLLGEHGFPER
jgi:protein-L-isoaspartate(D-aspartate) O-methyltransferase